MDLHQHQRGGGGYALGRAPTADNRRPSLRTGSDGRRRPAARADRTGRGCGRAGYSVLELMIAMTVASILLVGVTAGYSALARASSVSKSMRSCASPF